MWYEIKQKQQKMPKARANIYVYSRALFSGLIFEDEIICIPRTARYVVRNQAETAEDAESTSEHQRIQQYAMFRFFPDLSCLAVSFSCGIVYSRVKRTLESEKSRCRYISSNGKSKIKCWYTYQVRIYPLWL